MLSTNPGCPSLSILAHWLPGRQAQSHQHSTQDCRTLVTLIESRCEDTHRCHHLSGCGPWLESQGSFEGRTFRKRFHINFRGPHSPNSPDRK